MTNKTTTTFNISYGASNPSNPDKKFWQTVGVLFVTVTETGEQKFSMKLNVLPLASEFDGFLNVFPKEDSHKPSAPADDDIEF